MRGGLNDVVDQNQPSDKYQKFLNGYVWMLEWRHNWHDSSELDPTEKAVYDRIQLLFDRYENASEEAKYYILGNLLGLMRPRVGIQQKCVVVEECGESLRKVIPEL